MKKFQLSNPWLPYEYILFEEARAKHKEAYRSWTKDLDEELTEMYREGVSAKALAKHFGRTVGAIGTRVKKLELEEL
ncbi:MAG: hypothetical protein M1469_03325 [Bacteroidetes bacterium]|nr:hypothetical protein [Bacteroidota bacterium]